MNTEKQKAQMRKGVLELCILSIIAQKDAYASDILEKLKDAKINSCGRDSLSFANSPEE